MHQKTDFISIMLLLIRVFRKESLLILSFKIHTRIYVKLMDIVPNVWKRGLGGTGFTRLLDIKTFGLTRGLCRTELLEVTVCSPSCIMAISPLSSEPSARLLTELLWELALIDMDGREWELSMLLTVPVRSIYCSTSWWRGKRGSLVKTVKRFCGVTTLLGWW